MKITRIKPVLKLYGNVFNNAKFLSNLNVSVDATKSTQTLKSWDEIPGPSQLPIISSLHHFLPMGSLYKLEGFELSDKLYKTYGPIVKLPGVFGSQPNVMLFDAESVEYILRNENNMPKRSGFESLEYFRKEYKVKNGGVRPEITGLGSDHGEPWQKLRSAVNPILMQPRTIKLYAAPLDEVAQDMVEKMKTIRDENNMIKTDFGDEMKLWALESVGVVALGGRLNCFDPNLPPNSPVRRLIQNARDVFEIADQLDFQPNLWRYYPTKVFKKAMKIFQEQEDLNKHFIQEAITRLRNEANSLSEKGILEKVLDIDEHFAYLMASDSLFAGVDTTSNSVISMFYLLAKNPEKQKKLREEILSGSEKRPYLKACIKEAMRILPVASGNLRQTSKEYNLLGYHIPKNKSIIFAHQYMAMMECHYPKPNEYIPERWLVEKEDPLYHGHAHPFAYMPFGFGTRSCIGRRIAELELETFVSRVVQNFNIEWFGEPLKLQQRALNSVIKPFNFKFKDV